jgi:hypothetical protein
MDVFLAALVHVLVAVMGVRQGFGETTDPMPHAVGSSEAEVHVGRRRPKKNLTQKWRITGAQPKPELRRPLRKLPMIALLKLGAPLLMLLAILRCCKA